LAALRIHSEPWAGVCFLVTGGILCLAFVAAVCRRGAERAWCLGFASFGWISFGLPFRLRNYFAVRPPTRALLEQLAPLLGVPIGARFPDHVAEQSFFAIGDCLWSLLAAVLGGFLASALFGRVASTQEEANADSRPAGSVSPRSWAMPAVIFLAGLIPIGVIAVAGARLDPGVWAGLTFVLTWWLIGLSALGALCGSGLRRESWLAATLFGAGFLILAFNRPRYEDPDERPTSLPTVQLLEAIRPRIETIAGAFSANPNNIAATHARIHKALTQCVPMRFTTPTTLEEVLKYVREATRGPDGAPIPIFVDPIGLKEAEKSMTSTVTGIDLEGVMLRTSLRLCLRQLDLVFVAKDGVLLITSQEDEHSLILYASDDPFQIVGHCLLAVLAAGLGAAAAPVVCHPARRQRGRAAVG
jgi:hypothetical protein